MERSPWGYPMGGDITTPEFAREDWGRYRNKLKACLAVLREIVESGRLEGGRRLAGVEMEACLADYDGAVLPINAQILQQLEPGAFQPELARFTIEFTPAPRELAADYFDWIERQLTCGLSQTQAAAEALGGQAIVIGILPTITRRDTTEANLSPHPRYKALNDSILAARGEDLRIEIDGQESLREVAGSILFEAACTALHLHLQVEPKNSAQCWNAAQAASAPLIAVAANSPFFLHRQLHHETRVELFRQAVDTRAEEFVHQGVRPRVWFGETWLRESVFELFEENIRFFPPLLPICHDEDPQAVLDAGGAPSLKELALHNGTIYRWNRPVYEVVEGLPHFRIENRVLPAGPTVIDSVANLALYCGLLNALTNAQRPVWEEMSFDAAADNFFTAARHGLEARLYWPRVGAGIPVSELLLRHLIPLAREGLREWSIDARDADRYLDIIEARCTTGQNGATWQIATHGALADQGLNRAEAARELTRRYAAYSRRGTPVHTWPVPQLRLRGR